MFSIPDYDIKDCGSTILFLEVGVAVKVGDFVYPKQSFMETPFSGNLYDGGEITEIDENGVATVKIVHQVRVHVTHLTHPTAPDAREDYID